MLTLRRLNSARAFELLGALALSTPFQGAACAELAAADRVPKLAVVSSVENRAGAHAATLVLTQDLEIGKESGEEGDLFGRIYDIAVESDGDICVLDNGFSRIQRYDSTGKYLGAVGRGGEGPGEFTFPTAIATDAWDDLYVASRDRISVFDRDGNFQKEFRHGLSGGFIRSINVLPAEAVFICALDIMEQKVVHKFSLEDGKLVISFCDSYAVGQHVDVRIEQVYGGGVMDISDDGFICYSQLTPYQIRKFTFDGRLVSQITRELPFMEPPRVEPQKDGMVFHMPAGSFGLVALGDGRLLNAVAKPADKEKSAETVLDLFGADGHLAATLQIKQSLIPKCRDEQGRIYAPAEVEYPTVRRYKLGVR